MTRSADDSRAIDSTAIDSTEHRYRELDSQAVPDFIREDGFDVGFWGRLIYMGLVSAVIFHLLVQNLPTIAAWIDSRVPSEGVRRLIATTVVAVLGISLFALRTKHRRAYATIEIGFAIAAAWAASGRLGTTADAGSWTALGAAAYLFVRGLDNWSASAPRASASPPVSPRS